MGWPRVPTIALVLALSALACRRSDDQDAAKDRRAQEDARLRQCPDLPTWEACKARNDAEAEAQRARAAAIASAAAREQQTSLDAFLDAIAKNRADPQRASSDAPDCETSGSRAGLCRLGVNPDAGAPFVDVWFFRAAANAVRFSAHFPFRVTCRALDAASLKAWPEGPGMVGAGGERCAFVGSLSGLSVLIENNRSKTGDYNAGVHVFSSEYLSRDTGFADGVRQDEQRAK